MTIGLLGKKCGMTRIFTEAGESIPVTVIEVLPNHITQLKTTETDGYSAVQLAAGLRKRSRVTKPEAGHFAKAGVEPATVIQEFRVNSDKDLEGMEVGSPITLDMFSEDQFIDVSGISKGKGFAGVVKKYGFAMQDATHGNSLSHRAPGSIGQRQSPGKVFKGKRMAGHMGSVKRTVQSQRIVKIDKERNLVFVKGGVPGAKGLDVVIMPAIKKDHKEKDKA